MSYRAVSNILGDEVQPLHDPSANTRLQWAHSPSEPIRISDYDLENARRSDASGTSKNSIKKSMSEFDSDSAKSPAVTVNKTFSRTKNKQSTSKSARRALRRWWWWEIGSAVLSLLCILLVFVVMVTMHGKPLAYWKLKISINTTVSVLTTVSKSALMLLVAECISQLKWLYFNTRQRLSDLQKFDDASRGPWGSVTFIVRNRGKAVLATLGCLVTIVSLGFEPAAQQTLSFPSRLTARTNESAIIGVANGYNLSDFVNTGATTRMPPVPLQNALVNSFAGTVIDGLQICPTAECQFPDMTSFGCCASCQDVTADAILNTTILSQGGGGSDGHGGSNYKTLLYNYTTTDPFYRPALLDYTNHGGISPGLAFIMSVSLNVSKTETSRRAGMLAVNMPIMHNRTGDTVTTCDFHWCERKYRNVRIKNGQLAYQEDKPTLLHTVSYTDTDYNNKTFQYGSDREGTIYNFMAQEERDIWTYISSVLTGISRNNTMVQIIAGQDINKAGDVIANAITNYIRGPGNQALKKLEGQAMENVTFVEVRWPWLIWPATMSIGGAILLVLSILRTQHRADLLKSSVLALLFHGLEGFEREELLSPEAENEASLEEMANGLNVVFGRDEEGQLRFVKA